MVRRSAGADRAAAAAPRRRRRGAAGGPERAAPYLHKITTALDAVHAVLNVISVHLLDHISNDAVIPPRARAFLCFTRQLVEAVQYIDSFIDPSGNVPTPLGLPLQARSRAFSCAAFSCTNASAGPMAGFRPQPGAAIGWGDPPYVAESHLHVNQ